jgi:hypothetical protein
VPLSSDITAAYRRRTVALRAQTYRDLLRLWPAFDPDAPQAWMAGANALAVRDYRRAEALALEYVDLHAASAGAEVELRTAESFDTERAATSTRVTSLVAFRKAIGAGKSREQALDISYVRSAGAISRIALDGGRSAIMRTAQASPQVAGWRRTGSPQCQWCRELIGRGTVYRSGDTASFAAHDHCTCGAENVYTLEARATREFAQTDRFRTQEQRDANNARIRAYLRTL